MTSVPDMVVLRRVGKVYHRGTVPVQALRDVDFAARPGEFVALLGPSGCGKSTLLNLVGGLDHPTGGEILLDGASTTGWTSGDWTYARRTMIGIVFQAFHLLPALTAAENIGLPLMLRGDSAGEIDRCVSAQLAMVGLEPRAAHRPSELSGVSNNVSPSPARSYTGRGCSLRTNPRVIWIPTRPRRSSRCSSACPSRWGALSCWRHTAVRRLTRPTVGA